MLLETKLHPLRVRAEWVKRTEVVKYLAGSTAKLVLVDAPAGFGKSTVVTQWRAFPGQSRRFAWVSLDAGDNDAARFWWYIGCALQRACPELDLGDLLRQLRRQGPDLRGSLLPTLVNELAELTSPVTLVLDDYHMISNRNCHDQLEFVLAHLSPVTQIVLITRMDPPLPLGRLRAVGDLLEIRVPELRFAAADAAALVRAVSAVQLDETDLADLVQRTEGWPAGIYLAALSLRGHPSPSSFIRQFSGGNRFVGDFLAQEVLSRQPSEIRDFLCQTAILDRLTPSLCDAVVGSANATEIIDVLERENLFLVALDDDRQWFRYHQLFGQMLLAGWCRPSPTLCPFCTGAQVNGTNVGDRWKRRSFMLWPGVTSPEPSMSSRVTGPAASTPPGCARFGRGWTPSATTASAAAPWQRTARRGAPRFTGSRIPSGAG